MARGDRTVPVTVSPVMEKTIPVQIKAIGNVEAYATVSIKSRVGGELKQIAFRGGQDVKKGIFFSPSIPTPMRPLSNRPRQTWPRVWPY